MSKAVHMLFSHNLSYLQGYYHHIPYNIPRYLTCFFRSVKGEYVLTSATRKIILHFRLNLFFDNFMNLIIVFLHFLFGGFLKIKISPKPVIALQ